MIHLRPYQHDIINETRKLMIAGSKSILIQSPTGSGKTVLTAKMLESASQKTYISWFLVHRRELIKQSIRTFVDVNVKHGVISSGFGEDPLQLVQIASVQTLGRRYHKVTKPNLIIYDEAHHVAAGTWDKIYKAFPDAYHIGLTATPERLDGKGLRPWFNKMVAGPKITWLIENGYLSLYKLFAPTTIDTEGVKMTGGDFNKKALAMRVYSSPTVTGDAVREYLKYAKGKRAVAFCVSVQHSKEIAAKFNANGIRAAHVDGETDQHIRDLEIRKFQDGEIDILCNVDLFGEGFDVPAIECVILLRPTNSLGLYLQQVGRALRPAPGKDYAIILDHAGNVQRHGLPDEDREWSLDGKAARLRNSDGGPRVQLCPKCFAAKFPGRPKCIHCGHIFEVNAREIEHVEGELQEIDQKALKQQQIFQRKREQSNCRTKDELIQLGKLRGMKKPEAWAQHVFQSRQRRKLGMP